MKTAKSYKIIILFTAVLLSLVFAFSLMNGGVEFASAQTITSEGAKSSFSGGQSISFSDDKLVASVKEGDTFKFNNKLVINDFETTFSVGSSINEFVLSLKTDSYNYYGNYNEDTKEFDKTITQTVKFDFTEGGGVYLNGNKYTVSLSRSSVKLGISVEDQFISIAVDGSTVSTETDDYYKMGGKDKVVASFAFSDFNNTDAEKIEFSYVSQNSADDDYKQTFELQDSNIKTVALPRISLDDSFMPNYGELNLILGEKYMLNLSGCGIYSLLNNDVTASGLYIAKADEKDNTWISTEDYPNDFAVYEASGDLNTPTSIIIRNGTYEKIDTIEFSTKLKTEDTEAPTYKLESDEAFINAVNDKIKDSIFEDEEHYVRLGDTITVSSEPFKNIIVDDCVNFSSLNHTLYYMTPKTSSSTTGWTFTLDSAGEYSFFVVFDDGNGNAMDKEDFYVVEDDDSINYDGCKYKDYIFTFKIEDNSVISVSNITEQAKGYLNTEYVFSAFDIKASGYTPTYQLMYRENDSKEWVEISKASSLDEDTYSSETFTFEDESGFNYDGVRTFTPVKKGQYKVVCTVSSTKSTREASAESSIVEITEKATVYKVDTKWIANNVWSIVFLGVGTVCLIAVLILLFVKPKETVIEEDD